MAANDEVVVKGAPLNRSWARAGGWAFRQRSWLPAPLAVMLALVRVGENESVATLAAGALLVFCGVALRLWAVRHIGEISRTRAARHGELQTNGPYAVVRNPLYCANWLLWTGFTLASELTWMLPVAWLVFALQYGAIVAWEERLMRERFGSEFERYVASVPRWIPSSRIRAPLSTGPLHSWSRVFFSERGTLIAVGGMIIVLALKEAVG